MRARLALVLLLAGGVPGCTPVSPDVQALTAGGCPPQTRLYLLWSTVQQVSPPPAAPACSSPPERRDAP